MSTFVAHGGARAASVFDVWCVMYYILYVCIICIMNLSTGRMLVDTMKEGRNVLYGLHILRMEGTASGATTWGTTLGDCTTKLAYRCIGGCMSLVGSNCHTFQHGFTPLQIILKAEVISLENGNGVKCGIRVVGVLKRIGCRVWW